MDIFGDYKYLFIMCGSVMVTAGLFLFVMNVYNYHMLDRERATEGQNHQNQGSKDVQAQKRALGLLLEETHHPTEAAVEQTEPKATEETAAQGDQVKTTGPGLRPDNTETPSKP